jgi:hypothetical protein
MKEIPADSAGYPILGFQYFVELLHIIEGITEKVYVFHTPISIHCVRHALRTHHF